MKTTLFSLFITLVATLGFASNTFAQSSGNSFAIANQQSESLGEVTITAPSGDFYLSAPGNTNDTVAMADTATSVTIYGQTVPKGIMAVIQLHSGKFVAVLWPALNTIVVIDEDIL
jgi:hypothetical protein